MSIICTKCGAELTDGAKFCFSCGTAVAAAPAVSAPPPEKAAQKSAFAPASFDDFDDTPPRPAPQPSPVQAAPVQQAAPQPVPVQTAPEPIREAPADTAAPVPAAVPETPAFPEAPAAAEPANSAPKVGGPLGILLAIILIALIIGVIVFDILYLKGDIDLGKKSKSAWLGDTSAVLAAEQIE